MDLLNEKSASARVSSGDHSRNLAELGGYLYTGIQTGSLEGELLAEFVEHHKELLAHICNVTMQEDHIYGQMELLRQALEERKTLRSHYELLLGQQWLIYSKDSEAVLEAEAEVEAEDQPVEEQVLDAASNPTPAEASELAKNKHLPKTLSWAEMAAAEEDRQVEEAKKRSLSDSDQSGSWTKVVRNVPVNNQDRQKPSDSMDLLIGEISQMYEDRPPSHHYIESLLARNNGVAGLMSSAKHVSINPETGKRSLDLTSQVIFRRAAEELLDKDVPSEGDSIKILMVYVVNDCVTRKEANTFGRTLIKWLCSQKNLIIQNPEEGELACPTYVGYEMTSYEIPNGIGMKKHLGIFFEIPIGCPRIQDYRR